MQVFKTLKKFSRKQKGFHKLVCTQVWNSVLIGSHNELPCITMFGDEGDDDRYVINFNKADISTLQRVIEQLEKKS